MEPDLTTVCCKCGNATVSPNENGTDASQSFSIACNCNKQSTSKQKKPSYLSQRETANTVIIDINDSIQQMLLAKSRSKNHPLNRLKRWSLSKFKL